MNLLTQFNFFWQKHPEYAFKPLEIAVYSYLLHFCNELGRKNPFNLAKGRLMFELGLKTEDPLDTARKRLREAGLLEFENGNGRGQTTLYTLLPPSGFPLTANDSSSERGVKNDPLSPPLSEAQPKKGVVKGGEKQPPLAEDEQERSGERGVKNNPDKGGTTIKKRKEDSSAASAATTSDFSEGITKEVTPSAAPKPAPKKPKPKGATHEEIATLPLPFDGAEFAEAWRTFYTTNTKQAGKNLSAFVLMLQKLGKMPEGFAIVQLESAVMSNWQGVVHGGTPRDLAEWLAGQARRPAPAPIIEGQLAAAAPEMNPEFLAQQDAATAAKRAARLAELTTA